MKKRNIKYFNLYLNISMSKDCYFYKKKKGSSYRYSIGINSKKPPSKATNSLDKYIEGCQNKKKKHQSNFIFIY